MQKKVEYLRIILTDKCNLRCSYCHNEGMGKSVSTMDNDKVVMVASALYKCGIRKFN